jgi:hypothetical protein
MKWVEGRDLRYEYFFSGNDAQQAREISLHKCSRAQTR